MKPFQVPYRCQSGGDLAGGRPLLRCAYLLKPRAAGFGSWRTYLRTRCDGHSRWLLTERCNRLTRVVLRAV